MLDFRQGLDRIEVGGIDADPDRRGDQAFTFRGDRGFTGEGGEVSVRRDGGDTLVLSNLDGDRRADLQIVLDGDLRLGADDLLL